ncbi:MAG: hypothetical protein ACK4GT_12060 [Pararhodobacter sp.]
MANGQEGDDRKSRSPGEQPREQPAEELDGQLPQSPDRRSWDPGNYSEGDGDAGRWKRGSGYYGSRGQTEPEADEAAPGEPENSEFDGSAGAFSEGAFRTTATPPDGEAASDESAAGSVTGDTPRGDRSRAPGG